MELELGLALPNHHHPRPPACKRVFGAATKPTLPLFGREDGDGGGRDRGRRGGGDHETVNKKKRLVGWPPVKCAHRRCCGAGGGYVKVNMEGVAIGRKVDVSLHGSYGDLRRTLQRMFPSASSNSQGAAGRADADDERRRQQQAFVVTYEDGDGDWLLVGDDVPWEAFAKSVKRLKILA